MWFVKNGYIIGSGASAVAKITMTGAVTEYPLANTVAGPMMITKGPDGNLWFTEYSASKIGEIVFGGAAGSGSDFDKPDKDHPNNGIDKDKDKDKSLARPANPK